MAVGGAVVSAVLMSRNRADAMGEVLDRLLHLPVDEAVVADNGSTDSTVEVVNARVARWAEQGRRLVLLALPENVGVAARNRAIAEASGDYLLLIDDDSYPLPGALERLVAAMQLNPRLAVVAGLVVEVDADKRVRNSTEPGSFDWMMRAGARGQPGPDGFPTYFFPEGASLARRAALAEVGGYYEPFFFTQEGFELTARLLRAGWDVRYLPTAPFHHMKPPKPPDAVANMLRLGVRNHIWYFWLRFPAPVALRRIPAYALYDLLQAVYRGAPGAWAAGVADAWQGRAVIKADREPLPRDLLRRVELRRGRDHLRLVLIMGLRWLSRFRPRPR